MKELLEKMVTSLLKQVEEKVPETGDFDVVYERENVRERHIGLSHVILKVTAVKYGEPYERYLELGAVNHPSPYGAETVIGFGNKQAILAKLQEPDIVDTLQEKLKKLIEDVEYEELHPYG
jgi:hypothetical protein